MSDSENLPTKVFPLQREHTYDGVLSSYVAVGNGKTVTVSQVEGQPLCIDVYEFEVNTTEELQGKKADKSIELDRPMPSGNDLPLLVARYLAG
jgi:hypothetical protein